MSRLFDPVSYRTSLEAAASALKKDLGEPPTWAVVLGSGLDLGEHAAVESQLPFSALPGFIKPSVSGHRGELQLTRTPKGGSFLLLRGRLHLYEGLGAHETVFPVRALALWGIRRFLLTNAAGAINVDFSPGDFMLIRDHINLQGANPLTGPAIDGLGDRFPDMSCAYSRRLADLAEQAAAQLRLSLRQGVYVAVTGPSYETPAEIKMMRCLGADAVGMSTVPEVIALRQLDREVLGLSCITNMAAGTLSARLDHQDVLRMGQSMQRRLGDLLTRIIELS